MSFFAFISYFILGYFRLCVAIVGYSIGAYIFYWWLFMAILLMVINGYSINGY